MSGEGGRVRVPTNGHGRHTLEPTTPLESTAAATAATKAAPPPAPDLDLDLHEPSRSAMLQPTPGQLAMGFGIIASLILLFLGRRRRRGGR